MCLLAALLWHGPPHALPAQVRSGSLGLISSPALLAELADVLGRPKFDAILVRSKTSRENALTEVHQLAEVIEPPPLPQAVCRDPDDDELLALPSSTPIVDFERFQRLEVNGINKLAA